MRVVNPQGLVRDTIEQFFDKPAFEAEVEREAEEQAELERLLSALGGDV